MTSDFDSTQVVIIYESVIAGDKYKQRVQPLTDLYK